MNRIRNQWHSKGLEVVAIYNRPNLNEMLETIKPMKLSFRSMAVASADQDPKKAIALKKLPFAVLVDNEGKAVWIANDVYEKDLVGSLMTLLTKP